MTPGPGDGCATIGGPPLLPGFHRPWRHSVDCDRIMSTLLRLVLLGVRDSEPELAVGIVPVRLLSHSGANWSRRETRRKNQRLDHEVSTVGARLELDSTAQINDISSD